MRIVRFRLAGDRQTADAMIVMLHEMDRVDRVEEVADQMHARDDTSSLGLADDNGGGNDFHDIEVHVLDAKSATDVRDRIELAGREFSATLEFVDEF
ncbi:MAG TPA: hypothetical protein VGH81_04545 [Rudaea sp.]|jgi:hypothetical protein